MNVIVLAPEIKQIAAARKQQIFRKPPENPTLGRGVGISWTVGFT
jgi:hypothetical protein